MEAAGRLRLLIDQNLSPRLVRQLADLFPDSVHVLHAGLDEAGARQVRTCARLGGFHILTRDEDHAELARTAGSPPGVILNRLGNCSTRAVEALLRDHASDIEALATGSSGFVLALP